jgi:hypothetical protein
LLVGGDLLYGDGFEMCLGFVFGLTSLAYFKYYVAGFSSINFFKTTLWLLFCGLSWYVAIVVVVALGGVPVFAVSLVVGLVH